MEVRLQPRSDGPQHCLTFELEVSPAANIMQYRDFMGNTVHHFDIAGKHSQIKITARSSVEIQPVAPPNSADAGSWDDLDSAIAAPVSKRRLLGDASPQPVRQAQPALGSPARRDLRCQRRDTPSSSSPSSTSPSTTLSPTSPTAPASTRPLTTLSSPARASARISPTS